MKLKSDIENIAKKEKAVKKKRGFNSSVYFRADTNDKLDKLCEHYDLDSGSKLILFLIDEEYKKIINNKEAP